MIPCACLDWPALSTSLDREGYALTQPLLSQAECGSLLRLYENPQNFRSVIDMARYNFGKGEYKYFAYPLPREIQTLREDFYTPLAQIANRWSRALGQEVIWPKCLPTMLKHCHRLGQTRPTPLMLRYQRDDYNCLHQDLYGDVHFPLQVVILLSDPHKDFQGGELILVEQRPRMQSRPMVVRPEQGAAVVFPVRDRPRRGTRGFHRAQMRHGVGRITEGERLTLGLIFHDAA